MDDNYPPYDFPGSDGALQGILVDQWHLWEMKTVIHDNTSLMFLEGMSRNQQMDCGQQVLQAAERAADNWNRRKGLLIKIPSSEERKRLLSKPKNKFQIFP